MSYLITSLRNEIRRRNYSYRTEQAYTKWVKRYVKLYKLKHPLDVDEKEVVYFLSHSQVEIV